MPGYAVLNGRVAYQLLEPCTLVALVNNLFDARYPTFAWSATRWVCWGPNFPSPASSTGAPPPLFVVVSEDARGQSLEVRRTNGCAR